MDIFNVSSLISILMPVRNASAYLSECLESIQSQKDVYWELLVVDDASADNSLEVLKRYSGLDERIRVFQNTGRGIPDALRTAYEQASGVYLTRMDADDVMPANKLSSLVNALNEKEDKSISVGLVRYISDENVGPGYRDYEEWINGLTSKGENFREIYRECSIPSCAWMMKKDDADRYDLFRGLEVPEDYDLCFRWYEYDFNIVPVKDVVHLWRDHAERTSRNDDLYDIRSFGPFKLRHFLENEWSVGQPLFLWGCGKKGKELAGILTSRNIPFIWMTENTKKVGNRIHDQNVYHPDQLDWEGKAKVIVAVSSPVDRNSIDEYLSLRNKLKWQDYFFFF